MVLCLFPAKNVGRAELDIVLPLSADESVKNNAYLIQFK